jgi:hypothetical protein
MDICSCGEAADHVIARRSTADGKHVLLWSSGELTWALGYRIRGAAHPRTPEQRTKALAAGRLVAESVGFYDADEVTSLVLAARWAADRGKGRAEMISKLNERAPLRPAWTVYQADRDGKPTVRLWRLPRITHPGLVVWDESVGSRGRGRYQLMREIGRTGTLEPTGSQFHSLRELQAHLDECAVRGDL